MLKTLKYEVQFPSNNRTLSGNFTFSKGVTAITGPNESGKSLIIEVFKFLLFGTKALRGIVDDYKSLKASCDVTIKGVDYRIERTIGSAKLCQGSDPIATGTRVVNEKIISILGFGLDVFDISCSVSQGEIERLGQMPPSERKRMVDQVIGADRLDDLTKWCGDEALLLGREIAVLEKRLVEPTGPAAPTDYQPSSVLAEVVKEQRGLHAEAHSLRGWLSNKPEFRGWPVPSDGEDKGDPEALQEQINQAIRADQERDRILKLPVIDYDPEQLRLDWAAWDEWQERESFIAAHPRPDLTLEELEDLLERTAKRDWVLALQTQRQRLARSPEITCPCGKTFPVEHVLIAEIDAQLVELGDLPVVELSPTQLRIQGERIADWNLPATKERWAELQDRVEASKPTLERSLIRVRPGSVPVEEHRKLIDALPARIDVEPLKQKLAAIRDYQARLAAAEIAFEQYSRWEAIAKEKREELLDTEALMFDLDDLEQALTLARSYETALQRYEEEIVVYRRDSEELNKLGEERTGWLSAKAAVNEIRTKIKAHLVPALSTVASHLLTQMTGGARTSIQVSEDFEVTVDGQRLDTLSGSGKACSNLALRIGLGQVLTNNVLSIFIGDEIDASMDLDRSEFTQSSLGKLINSISQIILSTHKIPRSDNLISLGS